VNYQNVGNAAATNLSLQVVLPQQVDYISSTPVNPNNFGNTLTFNLGTLRANGQGQVTVKVRVQDNATPGTNLDFPAVLSYVNASGQPQSVTADVSAQVWGEANNTSSTGTNIFGFGSGFLPTSIFGWLILIIFILLLIWLAKYIYNKSSQPWKNNTSQSAPVVYHQPQPWDTTAPTMPNTPAPFNSSPLRKRTTTIVEE
jgi:hypothetical protein